jgi:hypothetical protein
MAQPPSGQGKGQGGSGQRSSTGDSLPAARTSTGEQPVRRSPTLTGIPNVRAGMAAFEAGSSTDSQSFKKVIDRSAFDDEHSQAGALLGEQRAPPREEENTGVGRTFDGMTPPPELTSRDLWKAINAPLQSREGRRSAELYTQVLNQFAVGHNPRYEPEGPNKPRAHIFVWDVTRAMNAEIPHFVGARELNLVQTCDWLRHEGPMRGWRKGDIDEALAAANEGKPVVALPKDTSVRLLAMVRPGEPGPDSRPRLAAAALARGNDLGCRETFGTMAVEYFLHA